MSDVKLPAITTRTVSFLEAITDAIGVPRNILASGEEIEEAWKNIPRILRKIPPQMLTEGMAKMCVAVAAGLFDGAINYAWNSAIIELRQKVKKFGLKVVRQVVGKQDFDEKALLDQKDSELLELCLKLNLITEDGYFFLDQCRDIRNNFSAAHPAVGKIDDSEFISFLNRCAKYAMSDESNPIGVDIQAFVAAIKGNKFTKEQRDHWVEMLRRTHEAQRELLFGTLHGIYCDPASSEETRLNSLTILWQLVGDFTPKVHSDLIDRHQDYSAKGDTKRHAASRKLFEDLGILGLLSDSERHAIISNACKRLISVHQGIDNFYNEPPFAERLLQLTSQSAVPHTAKLELVETVVTCGVGNAYGVSRAAYPYYERLIRSFSPIEVDIMMFLPESKTIVGNRIRVHRRCREGYKQLLHLIDPASVSIKSKKAFAEWSR